MITLVFVNVPIIEFRKLLYSHDSRSPCIAGTEIALWPSPMERLSSQTLIMCSILYQAFLILWFFWAMIQQHYDIKKIEMSLLLLDITIYSLWSCQTTFMISFWFNRHTQFRKCLLKRYFLLYVYLAEVKIKVILLSGFFDEVNSPGFPLSTAIYFLALQLLQSFVILM